MSQKRSRFKIETKESKALKRMRLSLGLSLVKAEKKTGIHSTILNHAENGRRNLKDSFIEKYVMTLGLTMDDWKTFMADEKTIYDERRECIEVIRSLNHEQLKMIKVMLFGVVAN